MKRERDAEAELNLPPGFRFHPTDEELVVHYLCRKAAGYQPLSLPFIAEIDLYKHDPWQLPEKALFGTKEWYFFTPRDRKYPNGSRPNRAAGSGYWKATGADKPIRAHSSSNSTSTSGDGVVAIKKALVFYSGRKAPKGIKTNWIMHEYRLAHPNRKKGPTTSRLDDWVLCRLYNKKNKWEEKIQLQDDQQILQEPISPLAQDNMKNYNNTHELEHYYSDGDSMSNIGSTTSISSNEDWFTNLNLEDLHNLLATMPQVPPDFSTIY